jgi:2'-5' RNA ligase
MGSSVVRAFIAVDLSSEVKKGLEQVSGELKRLLPGNAIRWVPVANIHLTLKFLGDVSQANIAALKKILDSVAVLHQACEFRAGGIGAFPRLTQPRVVWIGIDAPQELSAIQHSLEAETARLGYAPEERPFSPHLTLGRVSRNATRRDIHQISEVLSTYETGFLGSTHLQALHLYRSDLNPGGAVYSRLHSAQLS